MNVCIFIRYAQIAQLVEQRTENPRVLGSIPSLGSLKRCGVFSTALFFCLWPGSVYKGTHGFNGR